MFSARGECASFLSLRITWTTGGGDGADRPTDRPGGGAIVLEGSRCAGGRGCVAAEWRHADRVRGSLWDRCEACGSMGGAVRDTAVAATGWRGGPALGGAGAGAVPSRPRGHGRSDRRGPVLLETRQIHVAESTQLAPGTNHSPPLSPPARMSRQRLGTRIAASRA